MSYIKQKDVGLAGLALLRNWLVGNESTEKSILEEIRQLLGDTDNELSTLKIADYDVSDGYAAWANTYDSMPNLLIDVEEPAIKSILKQFIPGKALDAACGTGRHSQLLRSLGFKVTGMDISSAMLSQAKQNHSKKIEFIQGDLTAIPLEDNSIDLTVCALALTHFQNIQSPLSQLCRVVCKGGHIIISDIHPWLVALGGQAEFIDQSGRHCYIPNYVHWHSSYLQSFNKLGLKVIQCLEPVLKEKHIKTAKSGFTLSEKTITAALGNLPIALIWVLEKQ